MLIDRMTTLDRPSRYVVYATCLIISGVLMYVYIASPHVGNLKAAQSYEPVLDQMIDEQVEISKKLVGRRKVLEDLSMEFDSIGFTLFSPDQVKEFSGGLEQLAEEFNCSIDRMDSSADKGQIIIGEATDPSYVESVEMTLAVLGEYSQLTLFIDALQHQERQIWLTSVDIEMIKDQERVLKCNIIVKLYVLQEQGIEGVS